jgi:hypothetical protein
MAAGLQELLETDPVMDGPGDLSDWLSVCSENSGSTDSLVDDDSWTALSAKSDPDWESLDCLAANPVHPGSSQVGSEAQVGTYLALLSASCVCGFGPKGKLLFQV